MKILTDLIKKYLCPKFTIAEVGVFNGASTKEYIHLIAQNNGHVYAIDWFQGSIKANGIHRFQPENKNQILTVFKARLQDYLNIITILEGHTHDMIPLIPDDSLDFCFIDASHKYSDVYTDIKLCKSKVKSGGILCGHDCEHFGRVNQYTAEELEAECLADHAGVIQSVYEHFGKTPIIKGKDGFIWWVKI